MPADGIFDSRKSIVGTDVSVSYNEGAGRYEIDDPAGTGTAKIIPGDGRVASFKSAATAAETFATTVGVGAFSVTLVDGLSASFGSISWEPAASRYKVASGTTEFAYVPAGNLAKLGDAIDQIAADKSAEGI